MANRWKGNIIAAAATTSSGTDYTGKANGAWGLNSQLQQKQADLWSLGIGAPNAPTSILATKLDQSARVSFSLPTKTGGNGAVLDSYTVKSYPGAFTTTGTSSPITITGLTNGTTYTFTVSATNSLGLTGPESQQSNSIVPSIDPVPGQVLGGGFYAGKISTTANGVADYYLIIAPKATGEISGKAWVSPNNSVLTNRSSKITGPSNSSYLAGLGTSYQAATFCEGLTIGGYSDWYLPAQNELEVLYYFLKPTTNSNDTSSGSNANAVSPEPISTNYSSGSPAQTSASSFISGGSEAMVSNQGYWTSSEANSVEAIMLYSTNGVILLRDKSTATYVRAVRRMAI